MQMWFAHVLEEPKALLPVGGVVFAWIQEMWSTQSGQLLLVGIPFSIVFGGILALGRH